MRFQRSGPNYVQRWPDDSTMPFEIYRTGEPAADLIASHNGWRFEKKWVACRYEGAALLEDPAEYAEFDLLRDARAWCEDRWSDPRFLSEHLAAWQQAKHDPERDQEQEAGQ